MDDFNRKKLSLSFRLPWYISISLTPKKIWISRIESHAIKIALQKLIQLKINNKSLLIIQFRHTLQIQLLWTQIIKNLIRWNWNKTKILNTCYQLSIQISSTKFMKTILMRVSNKPKMENKKIIVNYVKTFLSKLSDIFWPSQVPKVS